MMSKLRDSTKAKDDEITRNLVGLARTRPDIFGERCLPVPPSLPPPLQPWCPPPTLSG